MRNSISRFGKLLSTVFLGATALACVAATPAHAYWYRGWDYGGPTIVVGPVAPAPVVTYAPAYYPGPDSVTMRCANGQNVTVTRPGASYNYLVNQASIACATGPGQPQTIFQPAY